MKIYENQPRIATGPPVFLFVFIRWSPGVFIRWAPLCVCPCVKTNENRGKSMEIDGNSPGPSACGITWTQSSIFVGLKGSNQPRNRTVVRHSQRGFRPLGAPGLDFLDFFNGFVRGFGLKFAYCFPDLLTVVRWLSIRTCFLIEYSMKKHTFWNVGF